MEMDASVPPPHPHPHGTGGSGWLYRIILIPILFTRGIDLDCHVNVKKDALLGSVAPQVLGSPARRRWSVSRDLVHSGIPAAMTGTSRADRDVSLGTAGTYPGYGPVYRNVPW